MLGNGVMAIASGLAGSWLVQGLSLGPVAPFDAAIVVLLVGGVIIARTWEENRGARGGESLARQFKEAAATIARGAFASPAPVVVFACCTCHPAPSPSPRRR